MCRMSGYGRDELVGSPFPGYFADAERAADGVRLTLDTGAVTNYELTLRAKDGRELLVSFNASVFRSADGSVQGIFASARDVTEQAGLQSQLAEEQAYNRGLIEASIDGLVTVDDTMTITDVNETLCRMVGRPRNQLIGTSFPDYFREPERAAEGVRLTFSQGQVTNYVLTLRAADGREQPVSFNAAVFRDRAGEVRGIFASARGIADQQELERQLRDSQLYTRSLIESNVDALMTTDSVGVITDVNKQMEWLTGHTREELIGSRFKQYFTDPDRAEAGIKLVLRDGRVTNYELTGRAKDGRQTVVSYNAATFNDRDGKLQGVFAAARDVTDQKALEQQLREQQTYLRGLLESSVDGLITVDPEGFISDVNSRMCEMTDYGRAELIGTRFADYFTDPGLARSGVQQTFEAGFVTEYALTLISRARRHLRVSFNASVFKGPDGDVRGIFASARDITDRVRLEDQLREQQTYLRGLIESSVDGLVTVDPDGFITDVNEQMCRMAGYGRAELIGSVFNQYFTNQDAADTGVKQTLARGVVTNYELVLRHQSGRKATVSFNASVFRSAEGRVQGIFASARDISEQSRLQRQLAEHQAYNRSLIEASADALFAIAPDGVITDVNEEATRLSRFTRQHLVSSAFADYFTDPGRARAGVQETFDSGRVLGYELTMVTRHARKITVSFNAGVFTDAAGEPLGILASARDSTAQKQLEQQLRDSQVYTRSLIESNIDALMTTDPIGVITDVNQQMEALTGYPRDDLIGSPFKRYFTDPALAEDGIRLVLHEGKVENYELTASSRDGHETVVSYNASAFYDQDHKLQGVFAAARDVTERKRFEQTLQENLELANANTAKDQFLAGISHELRTPLNAILGFTGTLLMGLPGPLNDEQRRQLDIVQSSGKHLLSIINDLLNLALIESGNLDLTLAPVVCQDVLTEVAETLRPLVEGKGLRFSIDAPGEEITLRTDRRALSQIIINLANNAIKFTDTGSITLALALADGGHSVRLSVADTGAGIAEEDQDRLFHAFEQVGEAKARKLEGTGLGLYISQKLAEILGGGILMDSTLGAGSTFTVSLPAA
jgi:PAS domain S-box-containing protein